MNHYFNNIKTKMAKQITNPTALAQYLMVNGQVFPLLVEHDVLNGRTEDQWDDEGWRERLAQLRAEKMPKRNLLRCPMSRHKALAIKREA